MRRTRPRAWLVSASISLLAAGELVSVACAEDYLEPSETDLRQPVSTASLAANYQPDPTPPTPPPAAGQPPAPVLPETEVRAQPQGGNQPQGATGGQPPMATPPVNSDIYPLPSILRGTIFTNEVTEGYNADDSTVGSIINTPNLTYPGTINTVTRQVIADQQAINFTDILRDIGSAVAAPGGNGILLQDSFFMRGFEVTTQNYRKDGFLDPTFVARDFANVSRVDVLKGPSSVLYGAAQPAGTVNLTTKRATVDPYYYGAITTGSFNLQRYAFDVNSPLFGNKDLLFRLNGAYTHTDSFRQSVFNQRTFIAPTLTWVIDDVTSLTWSTEYENNKFRMDSGTVAINNNPFAQSRNTFNGDPNGDLAHYNSYRSTLMFTKVLNDTWTFNTGVSSLFYNTPSTATTPDVSSAISGQPITDASSVLRDQNVAAPFKEQNQDFITNLAGDFDTGKINHKVLIGTEFDWFITNHDQFTTSTGGLFGPITGPVTPPTFNLSNVYSQFDNPAFRQTREGFYLQDMMEVGRFKFMLASRFDWLQQTYARTENIYLGASPANGGIFYPPFSTPELRTVDNFYHWSPKAGFTYDLIPEVFTTYGTYSQSFTPSVGVVNFTATPLNPQIGNIAEGGFKAQITPKMLATIGGFHITQTNVNTEIQNTSGLPGPAFIVSQIGLQRSQGLEANLTGNITERWSTVTNWAYTDSRAESIDPTIDGKRVRGVPMYNGNIWTRYNFVQESNHVVGGALGMIYVGSRLGDYNSPLMDPAYTRWDMAGFYTLGRLTASLYWENIFDTDYVTSSISQYSVFRGAPVNVRGQIAFVW